MKISIENRYLEVIAARTPEIKIFCEQVVQMVPKKQALEAVSLVELDDVRLPVFVCVSFMPPQLDIPLRPVLSLKPSFFAAGRLYSRSASGLSSFSIHLFLQNFP